MAEDVQLQRLCKVQEFRDLNNKLINYVLSMNVLLLWFEQRTLVERIQFNQTDFKLQTGNILFTWNVWQDKMLDQVDVLKFAK